MTFNWYYSYKTRNYPPKDFEIQIPKNTNLPIDLKNENWTTVEKFQNLKTQQQLGAADKWAEFQFLSGPTNTRFVRILIKNNLGDTNRIMIGRVKFE